MSKGQRPSSCPLEPRLTAGSRDRHGRRGRGEIGIAIEPRRDLARNRAADGGDLLEPGGAAGPVDLGDAAARRRGRSGSCGFIQSSDLKNFCEGSCGFIQDSDMKNLCEGSCGFIQDSDVKNFCEGSCGFIQDSDIKNLCEGSCGFIQDSDMKNLCEGSCGFIQDPDVKNLCG
ncbi:MAG: hypothetical protein HYY06_05440 [Deltaproteobacteria bacterium]|nr:hypothetical protein [Deltaproteobacteria bacterium]